MRFAAVSVTLLGATPAIAQSLFARQSPYPACANPCLGATNATGCVSSDLHCLCSNSAFVTNTTNCMYGACSGTDLQNALQTARDVCAKVGVTLTSAPAGAPTGSASPSSTARSGASSISYSALLGLGAATVAAFAALSI